MGMGMGMEMGIELGMGMGMGDYMELCSNKTKQIPSLNPIWRSQSNESKIANGNVLW